MAQPVTTSCSDLPQRSVWPDKSRHFVHTVCINKLHLVANCWDKRYHRTTSGNFYTIWLRCVNILPAMSGRPDVARQLCGDVRSSIHNLFTYIRDLSGQCSDHAMSRQPHHVVPMSCHSSSGHSEWPEYSLSCRVATYVTNELYCTFSYVHDNN